MNFVDPSGLLKGTGGIGSVSDAIGGAIGKDAQDVKNSAKSCFEKAEALCDKYDVAEQRVCGAA